MSYEESIREWLKQADEMAARPEEMLPDGRKPKEVAEQLIEKSLRHDPTHGEALSMWVDWYVRTGRGPMVMKRLNRVIKDYPNAVGPYRAIAAFMRITGKLDLAIQYFQNLLGEATEESLGILHLCLGELYAAKGDLAALRLIRTEMAKFPPVDPLTQGMLCLEDNDGAGILALSEKIEDEAMKYTLWGMIAEANGDLNNAGQYFFHVSNLENPNWYAYNSLATMWLQNNNVEYTKAYLDLAEELAPNAPEVFLTKARYYQLIEDGEKARPIKVKLLSLSGCFARTRRLAQKHLW